MVPPQRGNRCMPILVSLRNYLARWPGEQRFVILAAV